MENSSINWMTTAAKNYMYDIYMYYTKIESYKSPDYFAIDYDKHSSKVYTDGMYIKQMVCNERYIFVLVKFKSGYNVLFVIDTTLPTDSYKIFDKAYGEPCWQNADLDEINLTRPNEMKTVHVYSDINSDRIKLYCVQDSSDEQCVLISENQINLYKDGKLFVHDYSFTVKNTSIEIDKLVLYDEFNVQYTYLFTQDSPTVKYDESNSILHNCIDYDKYNNIRIDQKGIRYRITHIDKIPTYVMLPIYSDDAYHDKKCLSKNICAMQIDSTGLVYLSRNEVD